MIIDLTHSLCNTLFMVTAYSRHNHFEKCYNGMLSFNPHATSIPKPIMKILGMTRGLIITQLEVYNMLLRNFALKGILFTANNTQYITVTSDLIELFPSKSGKIVSLKYFINAFFWIYIQEHVDEKMKCNEKSNQESLIVNTD